MDVSVAYGSIGVLEREETWDDAMCKWMAMDGIVQLQDEENTAYSR